MEAVDGHLDPDRRDDFEALVRDPGNARHFRDEPVPLDDIEHMVDLAMCAANACTTPSWRFIAVRNRDLIREMQGAVLDRFEELAQKPGLALQEQKRVAARAQALLFAKAPLCVAVVTLPFVSPMEELLELGGMTQEERNQLCVRPELQSAGAAVQLLTTAAHSMGYAACWTCAPIVAGERLGQLLKVEPPAQLVALVAIGRPAERPLAARRLPLEQVLSVR